LPIPTHGWLGSTRRPAVTRKFAKRNSTSAVGWMCCRMMG